MSRSDGSAARIASLPRRLAAILYDSLLVTALLIGAGALAFALRDGAAPPVNASWYTLYLIAIGFAFFAFFWLRAGQTLGMRAWRLRLVTCSGEPVTLRHALLRYFGAIVSWLALAGGFLWQLVDRDSLSWHDRLSRTYLVHEPL